MECLGVNVFFFILCKVIGTFDVTAVCCGQALKCKQTLIVNSRITGIVPIS